jgi:phospholipid/cholesterol/gamma-HCH transport system substrate-binding protein
MRRPASKRSNAIAGLVAVGIACVGLFFAFTKANPFADPFEVRAAFAELNQLKTNSPVRTAGVEIGTVKKIEAGEGTSSIVTMEIRDAGLPIKRDATLKIRPRIFLEGNYFVDLQPGTPQSEPVEDGDMIPIQQTAAPVAFGQFLEMLQSDTREDLRTALQEYGKAISGEGGRGFNRSIRFWEPAFRNTAMVNDATRGQNDGDLSGYLAGFRRVAEGLDRDPEALKDLITNFAQTAGAFAREQENLSATIRELPPTLRAGNRAFASLREAFPSVRRFAADAEPTIRESGPALDAQLPLVRQLRGLMQPDELQGLARDLRGTVPSLASFNRGSIPLQEQTRALGSCQVNNIIPWQDETVPDPNFPAVGPIYQEASRQFAGLAAESRSFDANGQYVRSYANNANFASVLGDGRFFLTDLPVQGVNPPRKRGGAPPYRPDVACETQERPDMRSRPDAPPRQVRINQNAPGAAARRLAANARLMEFMQDSLKSSGLDKAYTLSDEPLKAAEIDDVKKTLGIGR